MSALGLVVNMIVLWNTLYMDAILTQLRHEGYPVRPEDEARLSPFGHEHINMLGRYSFSVPEAVARGELRPLGKASESELLNSIGTNTHEPSTFPTSADRGRTR
ncbi:hypothetical protein ALP80_200098 [Pseudomonas savastanoi pv. fraxini]|nr:hypothetical protein ALP80_200098 [Pseudomonas savastanoi pv. fraxini]